MKEPNEKPEKQHERLEDVSEVVVALDRSVGDEGQAAEQLHADDGVDEEQHPHQHANVRQSLKVCKQTLCKVKHRKKKGNK